MIRSHAILLALAVWAGAMGLEGCAPRASGAPASAGPDGPQGLTARRGAFERRVLLTGALEADRAILLTVPRTPSWQVELRWIAEDGAAVRAGDRVAELDTSAFASELEDRETALQERLAELDRRRAELLAEQRDKEFEVARLGAELDKARLEAEVPEGLVPLQELEKRRLTLAKAELELDKAEADLAAHREASAAELEVLEIEIGKMRREIEAAREAISELTLEAPEGGIFLVATHPWEDRKLQAGDTVWVGMTVATLPDLGSVVVQARLPDVDDGSIAPGMPAVVTLDTFPDRSFRGTVGDVAPVAQEQGMESSRRFFHTVIDLEETDPERMIPGMSARVEVLAERREDALLVPRRAVETGDGTAGEAREAVVELSGGERARVLLGPCNELECVVEEGLDPGGVLEAAP